MNTHGEPSPARAILSLALGAIVILGLLAVLAWLGMQRVSPAAARAWAIVTTFLLPVALWIGYRLGDRQVREAEAEARGTLVGIQAGAKEVMAAAQQVADLRPAAITATRRALREDAPPQIVVLPGPNRDPVFTMRRELAAGDDVVLE